MNTTQKTELTNQLSDAIAVMIDSIEAGRAGFDYAIKEYVDQTDNELSSTLQQFVTEMKLEDSQPIYEEGDEIPNLNNERRAALQNVAIRLNHPDVTAFTEAMIEAQDKRLNLVAMLRQQATQLQQ